MGKASVKRCYLCDRPAVWHILLGGEDEPAEDSLACEQHARDHMREPIEADWGLPPASHGAHFEHVDR
jgi:hypothetical protein